MTTPRAVFFGTPSAAVPVLAALTDVAEVILVVTRTDKPAGRSRRPRPPAVKEAAIDWGLPISQPVRAGEVADRIAGADVAVLAAYGQLIKAPLLAVPRCGFVNVHYSLLPRWRGAAPVERAILAGDATTGVSLMVMDEGLDTGPVLVAEGTPIGPAEHAGELTARLAGIGGRLVADYLPAFLAGDIVAMTQDERAATSAPRLTVEEARLDPAEPAAQLARRVRAFHPRPGAWLLVNGDRFKVVSARAAAAAGVAVGAIEAVEGRVVLGTAAGALELLQVQPSGKPVMNAAAWMNGRRGQPAQTG